MGTFELRLRLQFKTSSRVNILRSKNIVNCSYAHIMTSSLGHFYNIGVPAFVVLIDNHSVIKGEHPQDFWLLLAEEIL